MAERHVYGLIPTEDPPTEKHRESVSKELSQCGKWIDTTLPIPDDLPVCKRCTRFDHARPPVRYALWRRLARGSN